MGTLTLSTMRSELLFDLGNRTDFPDGGAEEARLNRWINSVYEHVCFPNVHKHWELESSITIPLVEDQFEYPLDTGQSYITREILGFKALRYVEDTADSYTARRSQLVPRGSSFFNSRTHNSATPNAYTILRKNLIVTPGPDSTVAGNVVVCEVWEKPDRLVADGDVTVLIDWWDEALIGEAPDRTELGGVEETNYLPDLHTERSNPRG